MGDLCFIFVSSNVCTIAKSTELLLHTTSSDYYLPKAKATVQNDGEEEKNVVM